MNDSPDKNCLALTIKKEHKLVMIEKTIQKAIHLSWKVVFSTIFITIVNLFI